MKQRRNKPKPVGAGTEAPGQAAAKKPKVKVISGSGEVRAAPAPAKVRVVQDDESHPLTPAQLKRRFATNLDRLVNLVGLTRKVAAHNIGIPHQLLLRLVSAGVSRTDDRNIESLKKIKDYFALPDVHDLWRPDLVRRLLTSDLGHGFVEKFRDRLLAERERRLGEELVDAREELALLGLALGFKDTPLPALTGPHAEKVRAILASAKSEHFKRLIDDYYELVAQPAAHDAAERA